MRYRLLYEKEAHKGNAHSAAMGGFFPRNGVQVAESHEDALRKVTPGNGRWIVLCEDEGTFQMFTVRHRTVIEVEPGEAPLRLHEMAA